MVSSTELLIANIPAPCDEQFLRRWIEVRGVEVQALRLIKDTTSGAGASFARIQLTDPARCDEALRILDKQTILKQPVRVVTVNDFSDVAKSLQKAAS